MDASRDIQPMPPAVEALSRQVVDAAFCVHRELGPGLLESVYESCLAIELNQRHLDFERQKLIPIHYKGMPIEAKLRLDFLVDDRLIIEVKAVEKLQPIFDAQLLTYLKITRLRLGLILNFNVRMLRDGIRRIAL
ncbi:MAG: GxxExxY protein [Deinococcus-Thermus bacterium]|jgi:GxxExxY protein|nr:GxxExxY protein [Deinococcota bacterium]